MAFYLGIDFGTSGVRAIAIDAGAQLQAEVKLPFVPAVDITDSWQETLLAAIAQIPLQVRQQIKAIAIDGTSSTVLLCDEAGKPLTAPLMYNDGRGIAVIEAVKAIAPANHTVTSATSSLAKLLWWQQFEPEIFTKAKYFLHQADWLAFLLHGKLGISDYNNTLKLGCDAENLCYPAWLENVAYRYLLPEAVAPGEPMGTIAAAIANSLNLPKDCLICAGTTDSIAAFIASGASVLGEAVTSLGSTLAVKLLSRDRVEDSRYGIYSHRLGDLWLVGGASNTGGAVLRQFFTDAELVTISAKIDPQIESNLDYYPLIKPGDRFPINDPELLPRLEPRPTDPVQFLHGLLESIARIEARGYQLLQQLRATKLTKVYTAGGGAKNLVWQAIRQRHLQVPVVASNQSDAAFGSAILAQQGYTK